MLENETNGHANGNLNGYTNGHAGSIVEDASSATAPLLNNVSSMAEKVNSEKPVNFNGSIHRMRQMAPAKIRKRKDEGGVRQMCAWIVEHQIGRQF